MYVLAALVILATAISATPIAQNGSISKRFIEDGKLPTKFVAFGDSYSAGIGGGRFLTNSKDKRDSECARTTGSYPKILTSQSPSIFGEPMDAWADFFSCTGDKLSQIPEQIDSTGGQKYEVATVSVGGNDFFFGPIAKHCIYNFWPRNEAAALQECKRNLGEVEDLYNEELEENALADLYKDALNRIYNHVLKKEGVIIVTGYARFFSPDNLNSRDQCNQVKTSWRGISSVVPLDWTHRERMNNLVLNVNKWIKERVVDALKNPNIRFVDIDSVFENSRFCENVPDPLGSNSRAVWFTELNTNPVTNEEYNPPPGLMERDGLNWGGNAIKLLPSKLQQMSAFHPKADALAKISERVAWHVLSWAESQNPFLDDARKAWVWGPGEICNQGGDQTCYVIPADCAAVKPTSATVPKVYCKESSHPAKPKTTHIMGKITAEVI